MGARVTVSIKGDKELIQALKKMGIDVERVLEMAAQAGAEIIAQDAGRRAPRPLIATEVSARGKGSVTVDIGPLDKVWYWKFLETGAQAHSITGSPLVFEGSEGLVVTRGVGHSGMAARPFLRPAFDSRKGAAKDQVGEVIKGKALP